MEISTKKVVFLALSVGVMGALLAAAMFGQAVQQENVYKYLSVFSEVFSIVRTNYVDEVSSDELVDGAFAGVTQAVDEFSYYIPPTQMQSYRAFLESSDGIDSGMIMTKRFGYAFVIGVAPGSPAEKAGVKPGDYIETIGDVDTKPLAAWQVEAALRGDEGEARVLSVVRAGGTEREQVTVTLTPVEDVPFEERDYGSVGYVKIRDFRPGTADRLKAKLVALHEAAASAVILDLRGNSTGQVEEAIRSADFFLAGGTITSIAGRKAEPQLWQADKETLFDGEVVILTDGTCASGAEVLSAAISGNERGQVVGFPTYGKAIVQKLVDLPSGGGLYLTIGHYTKPDLDPIRHEGIHPDVVVTRSSVAESSKDDDDSDPILERALSLLEASKEDKAAA